MTRLLIFGSSQAASLYLARDLLSAQDNLEVDWLVTPANLGFEVNATSGQIEPPAKYLLQGRIASSMQRIGGREGVFFAGDYDVILHSAVGIRPLARIETHPVHALGDGPVSDGLLDAMVTHHENMQTFRSILSGLRVAGFDGPLLCEQWVRPCALPDSTSMPDWKRFCDAEVATMALLAADLSATMIPRLGGMEYLTDETHLLHPERAGVHGNSAYADAIATSLVTLLKTH